MTLGSDVELEVDVIQFDASHSSLLTSDFVAARYSANTMRRWKWAITAAATTGNTARVIPLAA